MASDKQEAIVEIAPSKNQKSKYANIPKGSKIKIRLIKVPLESGEVELLMTSLLDNKTYPCNCFKKIYFMRWGVEIFYNRIKNILLIENFSGLTKHAILQDFHCAMFISNVQSLIIEEAQSEVNKKNRIKKYDYKINTSVSLGIMRNKILDLFINNGAQSTLEDLKEILVKQIVPIRKGRQFNRDVGKYSNRSKPPMFKNRKRVL